jgi:hypothetical protein
VSAAARPASVRRAGGCWPTPEQTLLLRAALLPEPEARAAYASWRETADIERVDPASYRILPLLAHNLGGADPVLAKARGVLRHTWSRNQRLFHQASSAVKALQATGIPVMLLKGAALGLRCYESLGHRPMNDVDVLVPPERSAEARTVLASLGWRPSYHVVPGHLPYVHAVGLTIGPGLDLDLHWHAIYERRRPEDERPFWENAEPLCGRAIDALAPSPTDLLLQVAAHGLRWSPSPPLQWAADLVVLLRAEGTRVDWDRLLARAREAGFVLHLDATLSFVHGELGASVPAGVLSDLRSARPTRRERLELAVRSSSPGLLPGLVAHWLDFRRVDLEAAHGSRFRRFLVYLATIWGAPSLAALPRVALVKSTKRLLRARHASSGRGSGS